MQQSRVAARYATALFDQAQQEKSLETAIEDVRGLKSMMTESRDLKLLFQSPVIKAEQKVTFLKALFAKANFSATVQNFLLLLVSKGRAAELSQVIEAFEHQYNAANNLIPVQISSAFELDADQRTKLLAKVQELTGKKPLPSYTVDAGLIGGFMVKIADQVMDGSIKHQLGILKKRLNAGAFSN
jgi:F-type H+-transporting ATPase subunit delta